MFSTTTANITSSSLIASFNDIDGLTDPSCGELESAYGYYQRGTSTLDLNQQMKDCLPQWDTKTGDVTFPVNLKNSLETEADKYPEYMKGLKRWINGSVVIKLNDQKIDNIKQNINYSVSEAAAATNRNVNNYTATVAAFNGMLKHSPPAYLA